MFFVSASTSYAGPICPLFEALYCFPLLEGS